MKNLTVLFILIGAAAGSVRGDPNIYGPGGVNLGPNGDLPESHEEIQRDKILEEEREQTRLLQQQVQALQQIKQQQEEMRKQQEGMSWNRQNPVRIEINYGNPTYGNSGWLGVGPFCCGGFGGVSVKRFHHGASGQHRVSKHPGVGMHRGGRGRR